MGPQGIGWEACSLTLVVLGDPQSQGLHLTAFCTCAWPPTDASYGLSTGCSQQKTTECTYASVQGGGAGGDGMNDANTRRSKNKSNHGALCVVMSQA